MSSIRLPKKTVNIYNKTQTISENNNISKKLLRLKKNINKANQKIVFQNDNQVCTYKLY